MSPHRPSEGCACGASCPFCGVHVWRPPSVRASGLALLPSSFFIHHTQRLSKAAAFGNVDGIHEIIQAVM